MKILVTGAAGFIGFHTAQRLLADGHDVVGLDNFNDYYSPALKRARDEQLRKQSRFESNELDLCDNDGLRALFDRHRFDLVVHLAAQPGVRYSLINPQAYVRSNLEGFVNVIEQARRHGIKRFVYASSSSVYGGITELPYREDMRVDQPVSLYAATKRSNELMAHTYSHLFGMQTIGLRFFTVYGPWGRPDMAYWSFTEKILAGKSIELFNHGDMTRDFTYVDDIVDGVARVVECDHLPQREIYNIGNSKPESMLEFVAMLERLLGNKADRKLLPMQPGDVKETFADIGKIKQAVGFEPKTTMAQGMAKFVEWYRAHPEIAQAIADSRRE